MGINESNLRRRFKQREASKYKEMEITLKAGLITVTQNVKLQNQLILEGKHVVGLVFYSQNDI